MRAGCFLPILAIGLVSTGIYGLYVSLAAGNLTAMTYEEFLRKKPSTGWIEVSDAQLNLVSAIHESNRITGTINKLYIPVTSSAAGKGEGDDMVHLLLLTKDEAILKTLKDLEAATGGGGGLAGRFKRLAEATKKQEAGTKKQEAGTKTPEGEDGLEKALRFMVENRDKFLINRPVRGLLQLGFGSSSRDRRRIQALDDNIAPDFAVLEDGEEPHVGIAVGMIILGLALAGGLVARALRAGS